MFKAKRGACFLFVAMSAAITPVLQTKADEWPQWRGKERKGVWTETGVLDRFAAPRIEAKWRTPISSGYTGPTVADGRVYVADRLTEPAQQERILCLDWRDGTILWSFAYDCRYEGFAYHAGPRASVLVDEGRAISLGSAGHLTCLDAVNGQVLWRRDLRSEYKIRIPNWGVAASPLVAGDLLIAQIGGEQGACVVAFDKKSGKERWRSLSDDASYSAPIAMDQAGQGVIVVWTGNRIAGLDPSTGRVCWEFPFPWEKYPIGIATPVLHDDLLLVSESHKGSLLLRLDRERLQAEKVWHRRREEVGKNAALHCLISTPLIKDAHVYGADGDGVLRCLKLATGEQQWEDRTAVPENRWATIHLIDGGRRTWLFNERGELIIAELSPQGFREISRAKLIDPTMEQLPRRDGVTWSHPAFAYRHVFIRNDKEILCADLSANGVNAKQTAR